MVSREPWEDEDEAAAEAAAQAKVQAIFAEAAARETAALVGAEEAAREDHLKGYGAAVKTELYARIRSAWARLSDVFRGWDKNGDGVLSRSELRRGLELVLGEVQNDELQAIMSEFDADGSGSVSLAELESALRPPVSDDPSEPATPPLPLRRVRRVSDGYSGFGGHSLLAHVSARGDEEAVVAALRGALAEKHSRVIDIFAKWDDDASGEVSFFEFRGGLACLGMYTHIYTHILPRYMRIYIYIYIFIYIYTYTHFHICLEQYVIIVIALEHV